MSTKARSRPQAPAVPEAPGASARPVRTVSAALELEGYTGWTAEMQSNVPLRTLDDIDRVDDFDVMRAAIVGLVQAHTFPLSGDLQGELTSEEVWALRRAYIKALNEAASVPKSD